MVQVQNRYSSFVGLPSRGVWQRRFVNLVDSSELSAEAKSQEYLLK
jgi:hypothetical protein